MYINASVGFMQYEGFSVYGSVLSCGLHDVGVCGAGGEGGVSLGPAGEWIDCSSQCTFLISLMGHYPREDQIHCSMLWPHSPILSPTLMHQLCCWEEYKASSTKSPQVPLWGSFLVALYSLSSMKQLVVVLGVWPWWHGGGNFCVSVTSQAPFTFQQFLNNFPKQNEKISNILNEQPILNSKKPTDFIALLCVPFTPFS